MRFTLLIATGFFFSQLIVAQDSPKKIKNTPPHSNNKEVYYSLNGKKNGSYTFYYKDMKQVEGSYLDDRRSGIWTFYDSEGNMSIQGNYKEGEKSGEWLFYRDKVLVTKAMYNPDSGRSVFHGFYPDGKPASLRTYEWETEKGQTIWYDHNGLIMEKKNDLGSKTHGLLERYTASGDTILYMEYRNGNPWTLLKTKPDKRFGDYYTGILKDGNGSLDIYVNDLNADKFVHFLELHYKNGLLNGSYTQYHPDSSIFCKGNFTNGFMDGTFIFYHVDGTMEDSLQYALKDSLKYDLRKSVFTVARYFPVEGDLPPRCLGKGREGIRTHVTECLVYPADALEKKIQGKVFVNYNLSATGEIENVRIVKGVGDPLDSEAYRVIKTSPLWEPGFIHFIPTSLNFTFPVNFVFN